MAITVVPQQPNIGELFGAGLSAGLQQLAQMKMQELQQRQMQQKIAKGLEALRYPREIASQLALLPESALKEVVKQKLSEPSRREFARQLGLGEEEPQLDSEYSPQVQYSPQSIMQSLQTLNSFAPQLSSVALQGLLRPSQQQLSVESMRSSELPKESIPVKERKKEGGIPELTEKQAETIAKLRLKKEEISTKERARAFKESKDFRHRILQQAQDDDDSLRDLDRIEELIRNNEIDTPGLISFLKESGFDIPALMKPGTVEYEKIINSQIRNIQKIYGGRVTNLEMEQFLKTLPSLLASPEGQLRVIANIRRIKRASREYANTMKDIMKRNKGVPPDDLAEQIDDEIGQKLDKLAQQFKDDLNKPFPKGQSPWVTAAQATTGKAVGAVPGLIKGALKGAGKGALIGAGSSYYGGPLTAASGAGIGALGGLFGLL